MRPQLGATWPAALRDRFASPGAWERFAAETANRTARRLAEGEEDHLVFFVLMASEFTKLPPVPPVPGADERIVRGRVRDFVNSAKGAVRSAEHREYPLAPQPVLRESINSAKGAARSAEHREEPLAPRPGLPELDDTSPRNERLAWLRRLPAAADEERLLAACRRAIAATDPARAGFYLNRGLSSDSDVEAGFVVDLALATARELDPAMRARSVVVVGPGLDWAPRNGAPLGPPQSHQPLSVLDSLVRLRLAEAGQVSIHALDVNPRVVRFISRSGAEWRPAVRLADPDLAVYVEGVGRAIGSRRNGVITLAPWVRQSIRAHLVNIVLQPPPVRYNVAVVTNLLLYYAPLEIALALHWLRTRAEPGAWLIHNDPRPEVEAAATDTGWRVRFARRVALGRGLQDYFALLQAR